VGHWKIATEIPELQSCAGVDVNEVRTWKIGEVFRRKWQLVAIGGGGGLLAVVVMLVLKFMGAGQGVQQMAGQIVNNVQQQGAQAPSGAEGLDDDHREFCQVVLADTEKVWGEIFARQIEGVDYVAPKLIMFSGATQTACGQGQSAMGPFLLPG
jgi:predicted metalloprotease